MNSTVKNTEVLGNWLQAKEMATRTERKIDYPPQSPMLLSLHADTVTGAEDPSKNGVYKLDDFLSAHQAERDAQIRARKDANAAKLSMLNSKNPTLNRNVAPLKPVAVGARSSKNTILLHEKYQALGIPQPHFTYNGGSDSGWTVKVSFPGLDLEELQDLSEERKFNSKQEAKEAVSEKALAILEQLEKEGKVTKGRKQKPIGGEPTAQHEKKEKEPGENYIGQLLEFQRATSSPQPTYTDYQSGKHFTCLLTIEGHAKPFGSLDTLHSSKKEARQDAARQAVESFKSQGLWPEDFTSVGGIKKKKKKPQSPQPAAALREMNSTNSMSSSFSLTQTPTPPPTTSSTTISAAPDTPTSYAHRVALLATKLSLSTPEYRFTPHPHDKDFHTVSCFFRNGGPHHEGPIGEARNVFGRKKAKEECARLTLEYLQGVLEWRLREGERVMAGVSGGCRCWAGGWGGLLMEREGERWGLGRGEWVMDGREGMIVMEIRIWRLRMRWRWC
ncbi:hypothetical protein N0V83_008101 [Neocucurbitaria cava]|uniref:DRBM domain-containing protein n=1 Tax=Neocucurbitaria cava TaxID=798079 RepID=A0A9W9CK18_9PLEO|nr:hypothetical protein N0V83_008101 [Neocucurbitaria cava]